jgi:hypothetical protein
MRHFFVLIVAFLLITPALNIAQGVETNKPVEKATPTPTPTPDDPNARGDCKTGGKTTTNKTKADCDALGGVWTPNKASTTPGPVDPRFRPK